MVNETSGDLSSTRSRPVTGTLLRGLTFLLTIAIVIVGWRAHVPGGMTAINAVAFLLTIVWAFVGLVDRHDRESTATRISPFHLLVGLDALAAAVALTAGRLALTHPDNSGGAARVVATIASLLVTAISFHLLLALPDGRLPGTARRGVVLVVYVLALGAGIALAVDHHTLSVRDGAVSWSLAALVAIIPMRLRYAHALGHDRERLQWFGIGAVVAADVALIAAVLHLLIGWPGPLGAVAVGGTVFIPLGLLMGESGRLGQLGGRLLVQVLSTFGFVVVVSAIYLIVVFGLGHAPKTTGDKEVLALSMVATGVAALIFVPVRERLMASATRFVYGAREAPDEVLRTFGSRLTRAVPMDELIRSCLRMKPHRILVGEVRGTEALTAMEAWNTGHPGGSMTIHANNAMEGLNRIVFLCQKTANPFPTHILARIVAETIHLVV